MTYLALQIGCVVLFTQLLRFGQQRGAAVWVVVWVNYACATAASAAVWLYVYDRGGSLSGTAAALGVVCGTLYFLNVLAILASYRLAGVGITMAVMSSGAVLPVVVSWIAWSEPMTVYRWASLPLVWVAICLMRPVGTPERPRTWKGDGVLLFTLLISGAAGLTHKAVNVYAATSDQPTYQTVLFLVATAFSVAYAARKRLAHARRTVWIGIATGLANTAATAFALLALSVLSAPMYFPMSTASVVGLSVIVSRFLWNERITRRQGLGIASAIAVVFLVNIRPGG